MKKRIITDPFNLKFEPFDNYGKAIAGMSWHKISYDKKSGQGTYIHKHINYEEFYMLDGDLTDADGKTFKRGNFVTFEPGSSHSSYTEKGCLILVFMRSRNKTI